MQIFPVPRANLEVTISDYRPGFQVKYYYEIENKRQLAREI